MISSPFLFVIILGIQNTNSLLDWTLVPTRQEHLEFLSSGLIRGLQSTAEELAPVLWTRFRLPRL